jgi:hypothetical protein
MAMSNSERQARWRERLKSRATGVTPEMVVEAMRIVWERNAQDEEDVGSWEDYLKFVNTRRGRSNWTMQLPYSIDPEDYERFGEHAEFVHRVALVVSAVLEPPLPTSRTDNH